jgi:hypothetical protein
VGDGSDGLAGLALHAQGVHLQPIVHAHTQSGEKILEHLQTKQKFKITKIQNYKKTKSQNTKIQKHTNTNTQTYQSICILKEEYLIDPLLRPFFSNAGLME